MCESEWVRQRLFICSNTAKRKLYWIFFFNFPLNYIYLYHNFYVNYFIIYKGQKPKATQQQLEVRQEVLINTDVGWRPRPDQSWLNHFREWVGCCKDPKTLMSWWWIQPHPRDIFCYVQIIIIYLFILESHLKSSKKEPLLNIFVVATYYHLLN